jgi:hypothetical protein
VCAAHLIAHNTDDDMANRVLAASLLVLAVSMPAALASTANSDKTLKTVTADCKDRYSVVIRDHYAADKECTDIIKQAMSTAPTTSDDVSQCPEGKVADVGSKVQKCMAKTPVGTRSMQLRVRTII